MVLPRLCGALLRRYIYKTFRIKMRMLNHFYRDLAEALN